MTAEIVNLRKARKAKARIDREAQAAENRVKFGRTKQERATSDANEALRLARLDQHRRDSQDHDDGGSNRSTIINVIDPKSSERDSREKPASAFSHPALDGDDR